MIYFKPETDPRLFKCPCRACNTKPQPELLTKLEKMRELYGQPIIVNSGPRCAEHNVRVGGVPSSEHVTGEGADLRCVDSRARFLMIEAALAVGFRRIGIDKRFLHVGVSTKHDPEVIWLYEDR